MDLRKALGLLILCMVFNCCTKQEMITKNCQKEFLENAGMEIYNGQDLGCRYFFTLYQYKGYQYYLLGNNCIDMISYPVSCEGHVPCVQNEFWDCELFFKKASRIGIVGVEK